MPRINRIERREALCQAISNNPFLKDEELARQFSVSVPTIRLDRGELGIPELRERTKAVARSAYEELRALRDQEIVGELKELTVGKNASSELCVQEDMVLTKARVARGHHLFAQANSLAAALVDAEIALTGSVEVKFMRPVRQNECVSMEGHVFKRDGNRYIIEVRGSVQGQPVLNGRWILFGLEDTPEGFEQNYDNGKGLES